jgi:hypothetical protein
MAYWNAGKMGLKEEDQFINDLLPFLLPNVPLFQCIGKRLWQLKYLYFHQFVEIPSG